MSIVLSKTGLSGNIKKVMETQKGYFINGQYYTKGDLSPVPFVNYNSEADYIGVSSFNKVINSNITSILKEQSMNLSNMLFNVNGDTILIDSSNSNISYFITRYKNGMRMVKIIEEDGNINISNEFDYLGENHGFIGFIGQDKDYIYYSSNNISRYNDFNIDQHYTISKINKNNFYNTVLKANRRTAVTGSYNYLKIYDNIVATKEGKSFSVDIIKDGGVVNLITLTEEVMLNQIPYVEENNENYVIYVFSSEFSTIKVFTINKNTLTKSEETFSVKNVGLARDYRKTYNLSKLNDGKLVLALYCTNPNKTNGEINVLEKTVDGYNCVSTLVVADSTQGMISNKDYSLLLFNINNGASINGYRYNSVTSSYEKDITIDTKVNSIGFDLDDNIFIDYGNGDLEIIQNFSKEKINIVLANKNLKYKDMSISETLKVSVNNDLSELLERNVLLQISGDAIFSNMTKEIKVHTLSTGEIDVPITINNYGNVSVSSHFVDL